jgi:lysophospholipase L1-like esterase
MPTALLLITSLSIAAQPRTPGSSVRAVLVGDSTVTEDSGWGLGFRELAGNGVAVTNAAANGRSSKSYRAEGLWQRALAARGDYYLIQFGHNDQPGKGPDRETDAATAFRENLKRYVEEARAAGGTPILVTSLVRRTFDKQTGRITSTQQPYVAATRAVAQAEHVPLVDLFSRSLELSELLGPRALEPFSPRQPNGDVDTTHLNAAGSRVFARLVVLELRTVAPGLGSLFDLQ